MNRFLTAAALILIVPFLFFTPGCKKNKTPQVYFSASSATVNANGTATVTVSLSEPSDNVVGVQFQSIGTSKIDFGTTSLTFMHDDSDKMQATIDASGYIDSMGHLEITPGAKGVVISFVEKSDDFPHAPANFEIKMVAAQNATIRQGSETYTYNVNSSAADNLFASTITYTDIASGNFNATYALQGYTYTGSGSNYNLTLNYMPGTGFSGQAVNIIYQNIPPFALGNDTLSCANGTNVSVTTTNYKGQPDTLTCSNFNSSIATMFVSNSKNLSTVYGGYWVFTGSLNISTSNYQLNGSLNSPFILYVQ